ncbi:WhiB family transcriptional regulator [Microbacterium sp.]|uniref:WhiB family transcriptional regulator n=1 Tax=Microbacterium sp. TaxID=51671 RepID=UPI0039E57B27
MTAAHAWEALSAALTVSAPACAGDDRFVDDGRAHSANQDLVPICAGCPVFAACRAYAHAEARHRIVGFWAGRRRGTRQGVAA